MIHWFKKKKRNKNKVSAPYTNDEWVELLSEPADNEAVRHLRMILIRGLKPALSKYIDRELDQFVEDVAQDGLLKILDNVHTFRGESKFTTWAMKIAVREGLTVLRRKRWENISINDLKGPNPDSDSGEIFSDIVATGDPGPELTTAQKMVLEKALCLRCSRASLSQRRGALKLMGGSLLYLR